jgi:protoporphyrinogen oxidase
MTVRRTITVVGGGVLGLALARQLRGHGASVRVLEAAAEIGGLAASHTVGALEWDRFYHVILESDMRTRDFVAAAGHASALQWSTTRTGFYVDGRFLSLSNSLEFLRFPPLSYLAKGRLAWTILRAAQVRDFTALEHERVEPWLRRHSGDATFERLWRPLLRAKLGDRYHDTSAAFIGATIARMFAARRAGLQQERFGWLPGGWSSVLRAQQSRLAADGTAVELNAPVAQICCHADGLRTSLRDGRTFESDAVIVTASCRHIEAMCPQLTAAERERLRRVEYLGVICVSVELDAPLGPYYVTNITDESLPFTAVIEMSALASAASLEGRGLVYLPRYVGPDDPLWRATDEEIVAQFLRALDTMYPGARTRVRATRVARARDVMALPTLEYSSRAKPPVPTSVPGLFIANSAQIGAGTLNINETLGVVDDAMRALALAGMY